VVFESEQFVSRSTWNYPVRIFLSPRMVILTIYHLAGPPSGQLRPAFALAAFNRYLIALVALAAFTGAAAATAAAFLPFAAAGSDWWVSNLARFTGAAFFAVGLR